MAITAQSEFGKLQSIFIKRASAAFVGRNRVREEWKQLNYSMEPDFDRAISEFETFESIVKAAAANLFYFPPDEQLTMDSIYCRDASIATNKGMIICNMGKPARSGEPLAQQKTFEKQGIPVLGQIQAPGTLEGGDLAWLDENTLAVGHTYRTNEEGIRQLRSLVEPIGVTLLVAELPHYKGPADVFHLMSILSPVDKDLAVVYSPLMPIAFREELLKRKYRLIEVSDHEFESMGCNVLALAPRKCLMVAGNPLTKSLLESAGCQVLEYQGEEISVKGGGGPTCLTRPLWRES